MEEFPDLTVFAISDVRLDDERTMKGLQKMFQSCVDGDFIPKVFVLCGNFSSKNVTTDLEMDAYRGLFIGSSLCLRAIPIRDPHRRQLHCAGGPHRLIPPHQPLQPLPVHPRAQRPMVIRSPSSSANTLYVYSTPLEQDRPCCVRLEPVSDKVYGPGNCGVSRGLDGKDDAKFSGCQA